MGRKTRRWPVLLGLGLCAAALVFSIILQKAGYLTYLNSDMASEMILARRQADTHSLIQMDWLYSTEIHTLHMNLFYALMFCITPDFQLARILGNTVVLVLGMACCVALCRKLKLSWGSALSAAALLPMSASALYAANMTVGGYYLIHLPFAFGAAALWLDAGWRGGKRRIAAYGLICLMQGFLSVRYVLCFVCPMVVVAALEVLLEEGKQRAQTLRFGAVTLIGFMACVFGYAASEGIMPRLFFSGAGAASSFRFNPLDGPAMGEMLLTVFADFLKLLGWRAEVALFSAEGMVNLCISGVVFLGIILLRRVWRGLCAQKQEDVLCRRMIAYALAALLVNLFCYLTIYGTYLNRYLILAVLFFLPATAVALKRENSVFLKTVFLGLLCMQVCLSGVVLLRDTREQETEALARGADMMDAAAYLSEEGYTHGYGTFWNVRVMQERTQGKLTFTGIVPAEAEEGAVCPVSVEMIRWLEPDNGSDLDRCAGKTFMLLTKAEAEQLSAWLEMTGAPLLYTNDTFDIYGFSSSQELGSDALIGKMKMEEAELADGEFIVQPGGRMRVPPTWREAGRYALRLTCGTAPEQGSVMQAYAGRTFELLCERTIQEGENELIIDLPHDDQYFMLLIRNEAGEALRITNLFFAKLQ